MIRPTTAPEGSLIIAIRPMPSMSNGSFSTWPPVAPVFEQAVPTTGVGRAFYSSGQIDFALQPVSLAPSGVPARLPVDDPHREHQPLSGMAV